MAVLIADNDEAVSGLLSEVLAQQGVRPRQAFDGDEAGRKPVFLLQAGGGAG